MLPGLFPPREADVTGKPPQETVLATPLPCSRATTLSGLKLLACAMGAGGVAPQRLMVRRTSCCMPRVPSTGLGSRPTWPLGSYPSCPRGSRMRTGHRGCSFGGRRGVQQRGHRGLQSRASGLPGWPQPWLKGGCLHLLLGRTLRLKPELAKLGNKYLKPGRTAYEPGQRVVSPRSSCCPALDQGDLGWPGRRWGPQESSSPRGWGRGNGGSQ